MTALPVKSAWRTTHERSPLNIKHQDIRLVFVMCLIAIPCQATSWYLTELLRKLN